MEWTQADIAEIMEVVERLVNDLAGGHTSIPQAKLMEVLDAVQYCVDEGLTCAGCDIDTQPGEADITQRPSASALYEAGYRSIIRKATRALEDYNALSASFNDYGVPTYRVTFFEELPHELSSFDPRFHPGEEIFFNYPMPHDGELLRGIDAIAACIERIGMEQSFLAKFDEGAVRKAAADISVAGGNLYKIVCG